MQTEEERKQESRDWNNWKPGSGRKAWSPFDKPEPVVRDNAGRPLKPDRVSIDTAKWIAEVNQREQSNGQ